MTELTKTSAAETFRAKAADRLRSVANMSLHELVDEFAALTKIVDAGELPRTEGSYSHRYSEEAQVAIEERKLVNGATRARFGFGFDIYESDF